MTQPTTIKLPKPKPASVRPRKSKIKVRDFDNAAGIPGTDKNHTSIRLDADDRRKLAALARAMHGGITMSGVMRLLVRSAYDKLMEKEAEKKARRMERTAQEDR